MTDINQRIQEGPPLPDLITGQLDCRPGANSPTTTAASNIGQEKLQQLSLIEDLGRQSKVQ